MNKLTIKFTGNNTYDYYVLVDGKPMKFEKNEYGNKVVYYETEKEEVNLKIKSYHELDSNVWLLTSTFFSIISIFGIFDARYDKRPLKVNYSGNIKLHEFSNLNIALKPFSRTNKVFEATGDCEIDDNESNRYVVNSKITSHLKAVRWIRVLLWLSLVGIIVLLITR